MKYFSECFLIGVQIAVCSAALFAIMRGDAERKQIANDYAVALQFVSQDISRDKFDESDETFDDSNLPAIPVFSTESETSEK